MQLEMVTSDLISLIADKDLSVKRHALEALNAVVHNQPNCVKGELDSI